MDDRDWEILLNAVRDDQCVLVLGPDSARLPDDADGRTITDKLAAELLAGSESGERDHPDLLQAAQNRLYDNEEHLYYDVGQFLERHDGATTDMHRHLARLPFSLCIQTSPDRFLYHAFVAEGKTPVEAYYDFSEGGRVKVIGDDQAALRDRGPDRPLIFSLHGHMKDARSLVLSRNDTLNFLVNLSEATSSLPPFLLRHVGGSDTKFLFFGFGFSRWYSQMLLHVLRKDAIRQRRVGRSIAVEPDSFFSQDSEAQTATFYNREHSIDFSRLSFLEFSAELDRRYTTLYVDQASEESVSVVSAEDMPLVFLCYNRIDKSSVQKFAESLKSRGLRVWWDQDNIKGGDRWSVKVQHAIGQLVDYFVVLHSDNFAVREAYSGKEMQAALDRSGKFFETGWRFIIPCHFLGSRDLMDAFAEFDYAEVDSPTDCDAIVEAILDDWTTNNRLAAKQQ